ncbi:MAG TPA: thioredoxin domain-containing protein [Gaiellaceae bacterium]|nr:thioredoxin domain-containing protein [Gaiellaceae bacterium]
MNRLAQETSPYLLQHADNPVDWYAWGEEAFERARVEDKPILLSIGYSACHWCHVMEHESFEDDETARLMNEHFVNVKVDREERPDVDALYMDAVVALTGQGGWPMTVFLTSEGEPFFGGTYYPPEPRHGMPAFRDVLETISALYRERRGAVESSAGQLREALTRAGEQAPSSDVLTEELLRDAARALRSQFDPEWGGFGGAPKFPPASTLEFLLRMHLRGDEAALPMVVKTLDAMAAGGMYDLVGGGFHRYAVDRTWLVPHFEKMLYDNALLASTYLHGWVVTGDKRYRRIVEQTLDYVLRELSLPEGAFASAQDADTEGVEGLTFTWTTEEGVPEELLQPFEDGRSIIRGELDEELRRRLFDIREQRSKPLRDDKAVTSWNGLLLAALAEAGRRLERRDWLEAATRLAAFLLGPLSDAEGRLYRTYREGEAKNTGFLEDYADVANGLYELHVATGELRWLEEANRLARLAVELFGDEERGGFFLTPSHGERLIARQKTFDDHPTPSGNSMLAFVLLRLARIYGDDELERQAVGVFRLIRDALSRAPQAFGDALAGLDLHLSPPRELAILGRPDSEVARAALEPFQPQTVVAVGPADGVPLLAGKNLVDGRPAVYVCESFACAAPVTEPENLSKALTNT